MISDDIAQAVEARLPGLSGLGYRVVFELDEEGALGIDGTEMVPALYAPEEAQEEADCTIRLSREDFLALLSGQLNPTFAYTMGRLKIEGSLGVAMKLASMLDE